MFLKEQILKFYRERYEVDPESSCGYMKVTLHLRRLGEKKLYNSSDVNKEIQILYENGYLEKLDTTFYYRYNPNSPKKSLKIKINFNARNTNSDN